MFVVVGSFMEYVFVLDTSDGSCEMLRYEELKMSGVDYTVQERAIDSLAKFRMLYGLNSMPRLGEGLYVKSLVEYSCDIYKKGRKNIDYCRFELCLRIVSTSIDGYYNVPSSMYDGADFFVAALVKPKSLLYSVSNNCLYSIVIPYGSFMGIIIPPDMIPYIRRLVNNQDLDGLLRAFNGVFSDKLLISTKLNKEDWCVSPDSIEYEKWYSF